MRGVLWHVPRQHGAAGRRGGAGGGGPPPPTPPAEPSGLAAEGQALYARSACVGCHAIRGVSAGVIGPDLTHFASRDLFGAGMWPVTEERVVAWLKDPPRLKPGAKMPNLNLTDAEARALTAYLLSLE